MSGEILPASLEYVNNVKTVTTLNWKPTFLWPRRLVAVWFTINNLKI
jgi:hypothetical protein